MKGIDFAFLDSGIGGIPYMIQLKKISPESRCVYLGDTANFPYGQKTAEQITDGATVSIKKMIDSWNPACIIIACNTISVTALGELRKRFPSIPIIGTVPAIKLAAKLTKNKNIGFLATNVSVNHPYSKKLEQDFAFDCNVISRGDPELVDFIQHRYISASKEEKINAIKPAVDYFRNKNCDTIILGCTHFTHMAAEFEEYAGSDITITDSRLGVAHHALEVLETVNKTDTILQNLPDDRTFFVTKIKNAEEEEECRNLCSNYHIPWGGIL